MAPQMKQTAVDKRELEKFVHKFYENKDVMHDLTHVKRVLATAVKMSTKFEADLSILTLAAYFHGIDLDLHRQDLVDYLKAHGFKIKEINRILRATSESRTKSIPKTLEGEILHDAHLLEGGLTFHVVKSLITGFSRGYSILQTIDYFDSNINGKYRCYLPENKLLYKKKEAFAREFFRDLRKNLAITDGDIK